MTLSPAQMICFTLYNATQAMQQAYRPLLEPLGITYPQYLVLSTLWVAQTSLTVGGIGAEVHLDSSTLTPLLKRLETAGLVSRTRSSTDERQVRIALTEAGRAMESQAAHISSCIFEKCGMDSETLGALRMQIATLADRLRNDA